MCIRDRYNVAAGISPAGKFKANGLSIDYDRREITVDGKKVSLTQTEYNIVAFLSEHSGKVMTYLSLIHIFWRTVW